MHRNHVRKELELFVNRSEFISENNKMFIQKILNLSVLEVRRALSDILLLEQEYCKTFRNDFSMLLREIAV